jgi:short subunit dehydrogenase-like uncharacterized protein
VKLQSTSMSATEKMYDIILFGVTGFTGRLAAEYLIESNIQSLKAGNDKVSHVKWAACARNKVKAEAVLQNIMIEMKERHSTDLTIDSVDILEADLICDQNDLDKIDRLRRVVQQTRVVLTCAGPFEVYGSTLVQLCAEEGVDYADITGETDFVRSMIRQHDAKARSTGACLICHCGNDCIPQDLLVYEMYRVAKENDLELLGVETFVELPESAAFSGGSIATLQYQLGKTRTKASNENNTTNNTESEKGFDSLLQNDKGQKSKFITKNISPKTARVHPEFKKVGPWVMAPVMVNCIRRSNALLNYNECFEYGDCKIETTSTIWGLATNFVEMAKIAVAVKLPSIGSSLVTPPGEGPDRETMESGYLRLHGRGRVRAPLTKIGDSMEDSEDNVTKVMKATFYFGKDVGYLYTAAMLVETGMALIENQNSKVAGVVTPAVGLGHALTQKLLDSLDVTLEVKIVD